MSLLVVERILNYMYMYIDSIFTHVYAKLPVLLIQI